MCLDELLWPTIFDAQPKNDVWSIYPRKRSFKWLVSYAFIFKKTYQKDLNSQRTP